MSSVAPNLLERLMEPSKARIGLDIATIVFMIGLSFNAGMAYDKQDSIANAEAADRIDINKLKQDEQPLSERVARMEAILQDIRDELRENNTRNTK